MCDRVFHISSQSSFLHSEDTVPDDELPVQFSLPTETQPPDAGPSDTSQPPFLSFLQENFDPTSSDTDNPDILKFYLHFYANFPQRSLLDQLVSYASTTTRATAGTFISAMRHTWQMVHDELDAEAAIREVVPDSRPVSLHSLPASRRIREHPYYDDRYFTLANGQDVPVSDMTARILASMSEHQLFVLETLSETLNTLGSNIKSLPPSPLWGELLGIFPSDSLPPSCHPGNRAIFLSIYRRRRQELIREGKLERTSREPTLSPEAEQSLWFAELRSMGARGIRLERNRETNVLSHSGHEVMKEHIERWFHLGDENDAQNAIIRERMLLMLSRYGELLNYMYPSFSMDHFQKPEGPFREIVDFTAHWIAHWILEGQYNIIFDRTGIQDTDHERIAQALAMLPESESALFPQVPSDTPIMKNFREITGEGIRRFENRIIFPQDYVLEQEHDTPTALLEGTLGEISQRLLRDHYDYVIRVIALMMMLYRYSRENPLEGITGTIYPGVFIDLTIKRRDSEESSEGRPIHHPVGAIRTSKATGEPGSSPPYSIMDIHGTGARLVDLIYIAIPMSTTTRGQRARAKPSWSDRETVDYTLHVLKTVFEPKEMEDRVRIRNVVFVCASLGGTRIIEAPVSRKTGLLKRGYFDR